jgi:hypothetical protein
MASQVLDGQRTAKHLDAGRDMQMIGLQRPRSLIA